MFGRKTKNTIDSLIGLSTTIEGNLYFKGGLRIDGTVKGNVFADGDDACMLVISEHARIEGEVRVPYVIINGEIIGPVYSSELLELQPKARINGDVFYKALEMHGGAVVAGKLTHDPGTAAVMPLAMLNT
jgi:cytoskeletal protein CcmA (bactofilin family)